MSILKCVPEYDILSGNICLNTYKKTLNLNNYGSLFKVYSPNKKHGSVTVPFSYLGSSPKNFCIFGELGVLLFQVRQVVFLVGVLPIYYIYSNGITEGFNNKIKVLKRNAYGYRNFDNFRKRIMLNCSKYGNLACTWLP